MSVIPATRQEPARRDRTAGVVATGLSIALYAASVPSGLGSDFDGYIWAARLLDHQFLLGALGCTLSILGAVTLLRGWRLGIGLAVALSLGVLWMGWGALGAAFADSHNKRLSGVENPDRTLRTRVLLSGFVDPIYEIQVEQTDHGLLNRRFALGCIDGDALSVDQLRWEDGALIVDSSAGALAVTVDDDGRPGDIRPFPDSSLDEGSVGPVRLYPC